jgi:hypothetical protein
MDSNKIQVAVVILNALAPVVGLLLVRKKLGILKAAAWLVTWGAVILSGEHGSFSLTLSAEPMAQFVEGGHASFHCFMAGAYTLAAGVLLALVAWTMLRNGNRIGWYAVLLTFLCGTAFEVVARTTIFPHGIPPRSIPAGLILYSYIMALGSALLISYVPLFRK